VSLRRKTDGTPLAWSSQSKTLVPLRVFFSWCTKQRRILFNPASELVMPREDHKLPSATLTHEETEVVLAIPDVATPIGLRDRAVMELL
jgi:integrase/recombinase XerD